jgi:subtilase family serine protease
MPRSTARTRRDPLVTSGGRTRKARTTGVVVACAATVVAAAGVGAAIAAPTTPSGASPSGKPAWTASATKTGTLAGSSKLNLTVVLNGHNDADAESAATAVSTPSSAGYGKFLSAASYRQKYAATNAEISSVTAWLKGAGFTISSVPDNHLWVRVTGTADAAKKAFGTSLDSYSLNGRSLHAPSGSVSIPASVQPLVAGVTGLSSSVRTNKPLSVDSTDRNDLALNQTLAPAPKAGKSAAPAGKNAPPSDAFVNAPPCSKYWAEKPAVTVPPAFDALQPYAPCGYTPAQLRGAYGLDKIGVNGRGVTVAIVDAYASPTIKRDADTYSTRHGGKPFAAGQFSQITPSAYRFGYDDTENGDQCGEQGWYGEETLDVEAVHGIAPAAKVLYVAGASCLDDDLLDALNTIVDGQKADIISNSWGETGEPDPSTDGALLKAYKQVFLQAALTGIGVFFSSGDDGDEKANTGTRLADFPATHPWVTAAGGTSIGIGARNNYLFEDAWGTGRSVLTDGKWDPAPGSDASYQYGGGGGVSTVFAQPFYQKGVVPAKFSTYGGVKPGRTVPDVSAVGDPNTGFLVGQTQTFPDGSVKYGEFRIGGTSLSCPVLAGIEALADQAAGSPHGFVNPALYELRGTRALHDVTMNKEGGVVRVDYINGVDATDGLRTTFRAFQQLGTLSSVKGYDDSTGLGTPTGFLYVYGLGQIGSRAESYASGKAGSAAKAG